MNRLLLAGLLVVSALAPAATAHAPAEHDADAPHCYDTPCTWTRADETHRRHNATTRGGADTHAGPALTAPLDEMIASGRLQIQRDATHNGTHYALHVALNLTDCGTLATLRNLTLPGYETVAETLRNGATPGLNATDDGLALRVCGRLAVGLPSNGSRRVDGHLRFQTGADAPVTFANAPANDTVDLPLWTGVLGDLRLAVESVPAGERIHLGLALDQVAVGDLGWGPGDIRVPLLEQWDRTILVHPRSCADAETPLGDAHACTGDDDRLVDAHSAVETGSGLECHEAPTAATTCRQARSAATQTADTAVDRASDALTRHCPPDQFATCHILVGMTPALTGILTSPVDAAAIRSALPDADRRVAAELTADCDPSQCPDGAVRARFGVNGSRPIPAMGPQETLDHRFARLAAHAGPATLSHDIRCWQMGVQGERCQGGH